MNLAGVCRQLPVQGLPQDVRLAVLSTRCQAVAARGGSPNLPVPAQGIPNIILFPLEDVPSAEHGPVKPQRAGSLKPKGATSPPPSASTPAPAARQGDGVGASTRAGPGRPQQQPRPGAGPHTRPNRPQDQQQEAAVSSQEPPQTGTAQAGSQAGQGRTRRRVAYPPDGTAQESTQPGQPKNWQFLAPPQPQPARQSSPGWKPSRVHKNALISQTTSIGELRDLLSSWGPEHIDCIHLTTAMQRLVYLTEHSVQVTGPKAPRSSLKRPSAPLYSGAAVVQAVTLQQQAHAAQVAAVNADTTADLCALVDTITTLAKPLVGPNSAAAERGLLPLVQGVCEQLALAAVQAGPSGPGQPLPASQLQPAGAVDRDWPPLRPHHVATLAWASAKLRMGFEQPKPSRLWTGIIAHTQRVVPLMQPKDVCMCLTALTETVHYDYCVPVFDDLCVRAGELLADSAAQPARLQQPAGAADSGQQPDRPASAPYSAQDVSDLLWSLGRTQHLPPPQVTQHIEAVALRLVPRMTSSNMASVAWGLAMQRLRAPRLLAAMVARALAICDMMPMEHMAELVWSAAKQLSYQNLQRDDSDMDWQYALGPSHTQLVTELDMLRALAARCQARVGELAPEYAPQVAWAYARAPGPMAQPLMLALADHLSRDDRLAMCDHRGLATLLWAFAKQGAYDQEFLQQALRLLDRWPLESIHVHLLHMTLWAMGSLVTQGPPLTGGGHQGALLVAAHQPLLRRIVVILFANTRHCMGQELSQMAGALAQLGVSTPELWAAISDHALRIQREFTYVEGPDNAAGNRIKKHRRKKPTRHVPRGVYHLRRTLITKTMRLKKSYQLKALVTKLKAIECAKLVWAFAKIGYVDEALFEAVSHRLREVAKEEDLATGRAPHLSIGVAARTIWAYAMQGYHDDPILLRLIPYAAAHMGSAQPQDVASLLWGLAAAGHHREDDRLVASCIGHASANAEAYTLTQLADVVWSIATMSVSQAGRVYSLLGVSEPVLAHAARRLCVEGQTARLEDISKLTWAFTTLQLDHVDVWRAVSTHVTRLLPGTTPKPHTRPIPTATRSSQPPPTVKDKQFQAVSDYLQESLSDKPLMSAGQAGAAVSPVEATEQLATVLHSLVTVQYIDTELFMHAAVALADSLHMLPTELLVQVVWTYAVVLLEAEQRAQAAAARGQAPAAEESARLVRASFELLQQADDMVQQVAPARRAQSLRPDERQLLWQAHQCCLYWAREAATRSQHNTPHAPSLTQQGQISDSESALLDASPFELHPNHYKLHVEACSLRDVKGGRRRAMVDMAMALEGLGYGTLGRMTAGGDPVLAGCGPGWIGAEQGDVKVAVLLIGEEHVTRKTPQKLLGVYQVEADLLAARGWIPVFMRLTDWGGVRAERAQLLNKAIERARQR